MDVHDTFDQCIAKIGKAKASFCLLKYEESLVLLCTAYSIVRSLIEEVYSMSASFASLQGPADKDTS